MSPDSNDPSSKVDLVRRRVPLERKISLKFKEFRGFITEYSSNLSMGGMFIRTTSPKPVGTIFDFELSLTDDFKLVQGIGEVLWIRETDDGPERPSGMGVRFLDLSSESRRLIQRIVEEQIADGGTPFELEPPGFPPPPLRPTPQAASRTGTQSTLFHPTAAPLGPAPPLPSRPAAPPRPADPPRRAEAPAALPVVPESFAELASFPDLDPPELPVPDLAPEHGDLLPDLGDSLKGDSFKDIALVDDEPLSGTAVDAGESFAIPDLHDDPTLLQSPRSSAEEPPPRPWTTAPAPPHAAGTPRGRGLPSGFDEVARAFSPPAAVAAPGGETVRVSPLAVPREPAPAPVAPPPTSAPRQPPAEVAPALATPERRPPRRRRSWTPLVAALVALLLGGFAVLYLRFPELLPEWAGGGQPGPADSTARPPAPGGGAAVSQQAPQPDVPAAEAPPGEAAGSAPPASVAVPGSTPVTAAVSTAPPASPPLESPPGDAGAAARRSLGDDPLRARFTTVEEIWGQRSPLGTVVTIVTNGAVPAEAFSHFRLEGANPREVIRLRGVDDSYRRLSVPVSTAEVKQVRLGYHAKPGGNELHVVVDLASPRVKLLSSTPVDNRLELLLAAQ